MVRLSTSLLALLVAGLASAQSFGRFGYSSLPSIPGFQFSAAGFRSSAPGSDTFRFTSELKGFRATEVNDRAALYAGPDAAGLPNKVRVNLRSPGFEMYFPQGLRLELSPLLNPYLSWSEGSVGPEIPVPPSKWVLVSFQDAQAPVLLCFEGAPPELTLIGKAGQWAIVSKEPFAGWVRFCLPLGHYKRAGTDAASLGQSVQAVKKYEDVWTAPRAGLVDFEIRSDATSVTVVWTFDKPGAVVPPAAMLARAGGYPIQILSGTKTTEADLWEGPVAVTTEAKLAIKFPLVRVPLGRSLTLGKAPADLIASASPFDVASLTELALTGLLAGRDRIVLDALENATAEYLSHAQMVVENHTQQKLPFPADGTGIDLAAAHALVAQCRTVASGQLSRTNTLFANVDWKRDWYSWMVWADDQATARRATALLSVAGALSSEPDRRLEAAMLHSGMCAERALRLFRQRRGFSDSRPILNEPMFNLRSGLFMTGSDRFVDSLLSEVRIVSWEPVQAETTPEGVTIRFKVDELKPGQMVFEIGRPVEAIAVSNLKSLVAKQALGRLTVDYEPNEVGECVVTLRSPGWSNPLPALAPPPRWTEG